MESQQLFKKYQPLICRYATKTARKWHVEPDDVIEEGYVLFVVALRDYDDQKASFCTYLYCKLAKLNQYCIQHGGLVKVRNAHQIVDCVNADDFDFCTYENFCAALEQFELKLELSSQARQMLQYIISRQWEVVDKKSRKPTYRKILQKYKADGWKVSDIAQAWKELSSWWNKYYYVF